MEARELRIGNLTDKGEVNMLQNIYYYHKLTGEELKIKEQ